VSYLVRPAPNGYAAYHSAGYGTDETYLGTWRKPSFARHACERKDPDLNSGEWIEVGTGHWMNDTGTGIVVDDTSRVVVPYDQRSVDLSGTGHTEPDGAELLDYLWKILRYYARWNGPEEIAVTAGWIMHTWLDYAGSGMNGGNGRLAVACSPRLALIGAMNTGKSRKETLLRELSRNATGRVSGVVTAPGVRNVLNQGQTVILDEAHRIFGSAGTAKMDLQGIIAGGYVHDGVSLTGWHGKDEQSIFGPIAYAAKPEIITMTNDLLADLFSRSFIIYTQQWEPSEEDSAIPDLDDRFEAICEAARVRLGQWAAWHRPPSSRKLWAIHSMPATLSTRNREIAQTLFAVADRCTDPTLTTRGGVDLRWAIAMRNSVIKVLLGGDGEEVAETVRLHSDVMGFDDELESMR